MDTDRTKLLFILDNMHQDMNLQIFNQYQPMWHLDVSNLDASGCVRRALIVLILSIKLIEDHHAEKN